MDAGLIWTLVCMNCRKPFEVEITDEDGLLRTVKEERCPHCGRTPREQERTIGVNWHRVLDFRPSEKYG